MTSEPFRITVGGTPWRVGRKVGRTIYDSEDHLIGVMDTRALAAEVVDAVNAASEVGILSCGCVPPCEGGHEDDPW